MHFLLMSPPYTIYKGPKLDAQRSQNVTPSKCQCHPFVNINNFLLMTYLKKFIYIMTLKVAHWDALNDSLAKLYAMGR